MDIGLTLFDIDGLEPLRIICQQFKVNITIFGGLVRRLVALQGKQPNLFDLVRFTSDIDLVHDGPPKITEPIMLAILKNVPFAECFRWQIRSTEENRQFWGAMRSNGIIPANLMSLSTKGLRDRWEGAKDIDTRRYRYIRNGFYDTSPLYRAGRDLEVFSALLYYRVILEAGMSLQEMQIQPGIRDARQVITESCATTETILRLQRNEYLRTRLTYLLHSIRAAEVNFQKSSLYDQIPPLQIIFDYLDRWDPQLGKRMRSIIEGEPFLPQDISAQVVSAHLAGDAFRLQSLDDSVSASSRSWAVGAEARIIWQSLEETFLHESKVELARGQVVLMASPEYQIQQGISSSSQFGAYGAQEFVHFGVTLRFGQADSIREYDSGSLACVLTLIAREGKQNTAMAIISPPCACEVVQNSLSESVGVFVRVNCWGLLESAWDVALKNVPNLQSLALRAFVLGYSGFDYD